MQKVCPCIIVVHSQGGNFGFTAALNAPDKVKALITIEPSGAPDPPRPKLAKLKGVPHPHRVGRFHRQGRGVVELVVSLDQMGPATRGAGGKVDTFELPKMGIKGNTHMMMMDTNSDDVAKLVSDWMKRKGPNELRRHKDER